MCESSRKQKSKDILLVAFQHEPKSVQNYLHKPAIVRQATKTTSSRNQGLSNNSTVLNIH